MAHMDDEGVGERFEQIRALAIEDMKRNGMDGPTLPAIRSKAAQLLQLRFPEIHSDLIARSIAFASGAFIASGKENLIQLEEFLERRNVSALDLEALVLFNMIWGWAYPMAFFRATVAHRSKKTASNAAKARHKNSSQADAKALVHENWKLWREDSTRYKGKAHFARDMLDKFNDSLRSTAVIEGWCRTWERESKANSAS